MKHLFIFTLFVFFFSNCKKSENPSNNNSINSNNDIDNYFTINGVAYYREYKNYLGGDNIVSCANNIYTWSNLGKSAGFANSLSINNSVPSTSFILLEVIINNEKIRYVSPVNTPRINAKTSNGKSYYEFTNMKLYENYTLDTSKNIFASGRVTCK